MTVEKGGTMSAQPVMSPDRVKTIVISLDENQKPKVAAEHECVIVDQSKDEEVIWVSDLPFRIDFEGDSPFYENQFNSANRRSGLVRRGVLGSKFHEYKYTIEVNGKTLDPKIMIFPPGN
jgi:hypothetical protein